MYLHLTSCLSFLCFFIQNTTALAETSRPQSPLQSETARSLEQENTDSTDSDDPMVQVTSVSQLRDIQPTDWAFQALQSLSERYGVIAGYHFDVVGANLELAVSKQLAIFGRYSYGSYNNTAFGDIHPNYWMAGISWRDLFVPGAFAGVAIGQPFIEQAVGNKFQTNIEGFYNFPISDNIRITPSVQIITNPANQISNGTIITGSIRTVFSF